MLAAASGLPAAAKDTYPFFGPLEIRITGANGALREFIALSRDDTTGASALVKQIVGAMQAQAAPTVQASSTLPHYRIDLSHLAMTPVTLPWARRSETRFIYYPGEAGSARFLMVEFSSDTTGLQDRWIVPSSQVAAMLDRHLQGLPPMGGDLVAPAEFSTSSWGVTVAALVLIGLTLLLIEDRRRWRSSGERSAGKRGRNRRS
jgi:hypothetical protein